MHIFHKWRLVESNVDLYFGGSYTLRCDICSKCESLYGQPIDKWLRETSAWAYENALDDFIEEELS